MAFDWNGYLVIAKKLKTSTDGRPHNNNNEALQRSAVSRAYYAVYHLAEDYAKDNLQYTPQQDGSNQYHPDVRSVYQRQSGNPDHQEVSKMLFRLHKARKNCDYDEGGFGNIQSLLVSTILEADKIKSILTN